MLNSPKSQSNFAYQSQMQSIQPTIFQTPSLHIPLIGSQNSYGNSYASSAFMGSQHVDSSPTNKLYMSNPFMNQHNNMRPPQPSSFSQAFQSLSTQNPMFYHSPMGFPQQHLPQFSNRMFSQQGPRYQKETGDSPLDRLLEKQTDILQAISSGMNLEVHERSDRSQHLLEKRLEKLEHQHRRQEEELSFHKTQSLFAPRKKYEDEFAHDKIETLEEEVRRLKEERDIYKQAATPSSRRHSHLRKPDQGFYNSENEYFDNEPQDDFLHSGDHYTERKFKKVNFHENNDYDEEHDQHLKLAHEYHSKKSSAKTPKKSLEKAATPKRKSSKMKHQDDENESFSLPTDKREEQTPSISEKHENDKTQRTKQHEKNKRLIRIYCWAFAYTHLAKRETHKVVEKRKTIARRAIVDTTEPCIQFIQNFIASRLGKELQAIYNASHSFVITKGLERGLFGKKSISEHEIDERVNKHIFVHLKALMDKFTISLTQGGLSNEFLDFLVSISQSKCTPPNNFLSDFEIKRLSFSHFGTLKHMKETSSKMIIGMFILIKVLIFQFLLCPWKEIKHLKLKIPSNDHTKNNLLTIGSILYQTTLTIFSGSTPVVQHNQDHLSGQLKIKARTQILKTNFFSEKEEETKKVINEEEVVDGVLSKNDLQGLYKSQIKA